MGETTYANKLKNPKWQRKRLQVYDRDNWTCQLCSDDSTELHVHHISYEPGRQPWEYELDNFTTLCKHCHGAVTVYKKDFPGVILKVNKREIIEHSRHTLLMLTKDGDNMMVAVIVIIGNQVDVMTVLSCEAVDNINAIIKTDITNLKTL